MFVLILLTKLTLGGIESNAAFAASSPLHCLAPMVREKHLEEVILRGTEDQQVAEGREIVRWFRSHAEEVDALTAKTDITEPEAKRLHALALKMHEKLREWSILMHLADGPKNSMVLAESAEDVLNIYLKAVGASPTTPLGAETIELGVIPSPLKRSLFGLFMNELRKRDISLHITNRALPTSQGIGSFVRGKSNYLATSHRTLAELKPGIVDFHEMAHFRVWAAQMKKKDVLFAGQLFPTDAPEVPLDEFVAYSEMTHRIVMRLSQPDVRPLEREELVRSLRGSIDQHRRHHTPFEPIVPRALEIARARTRVGFESSLSPDAPGIPKTAEASFYFPLNAGDEQDQLLVLEFAPQHLDAARRKSAIRLAVLQDYLDNSGAALGKFERLFGRINSDEIDEILPQLVEADAALQKALSDAEASYKSKSAPRSGRRP